MVVRALYGGKLEVSNFWLHMRACMDTMGLTSCFSDPDVWMRKSKHGNVKSYYKSVLLYIDYFLVIYENAENVIWEDIGIYF